jgi:hypothetical protein
MRLGLHSISSRAQARCLEVDCHNQKAQEIAELWHVGVTLDKMLHKAAVSTRAYSSAPHHEHFNVLCFNVK